MVESDWQLDLVSHWEVNNPSNIKRTTDLQEFNQQYISAFKVNSVIGERQFNCNHGYVRVDSVLNYEESKLCAVVSI